MRGAGSGTFVLGLVVSGHVVDRYWIAGLLGLPPLPRCFCRAKKRRQGLVGGEARP
jgi:hypothetical protein